MNVSFTTTPPAGAVYPLINFGSQSLAGSFSLDPSSPGVTSLPLGRDTYNLVDAGNSLELQIVGPPVPGVAYFDGAVSNNWSDLSNSTNSNWSADAAATQDAGNVPGSITDVILSANNLSGGAVSTVLGTNFAINSLNVNATAASTTIGNPGDSTTLTIYALADSNTNSSGYTGNPAGNGISIAAGAGPVTINVPVLLGGSQTWSNNSTNGLMLTNSVSGTAGSGNTQTLTLTNAAAGGTTFSGVIADGTAGGNLAVVVNNTGAGTTVFAGSSSYTGGTTINSGTVQVANANGLPSGAGTGNVVLSSTGGATLDLDGTPVVYINGMSGGGGTSLGQLINSASGTVAALNFGNGGGFGTFAGVIADNNGSGGQVALVKSGSGTEILSGSNTYSGGTQINGGVLSLANPAALSSGSIQFGGGTLQFSPSNTNDYSALIFNSTGPISLDTNGQTMTFASNLDGSNVGGLSKIGNGMLTLSGNNNYNGATLISAGTLTVTGTGSLSNNTPYVEVGTTSGSPAALIFGPSSVTNLTTLGGSLTASYGSTVTIEAGASFTTAGFVKIASLAQNVAGGTLNQSGGTVTITGFDSNNRSLTIGEFGGDTGVYNLSGGSLSVPNGTVFLPWNGNGILNISSGSASFGTLKFGNGASASTTTLNLTGGGALYLGSGGMVTTTVDTATVNLGNGTVGATSPWSSRGALDLDRVALWVRCHELRYHRRQHHLERRDLRQRRHDASRREYPYAWQRRRAGQQFFWQYPGIQRHAGSERDRQQYESNGHAARRYPLPASRTITVNNGDALSFTQSNALGGGGSTIATPVGDQQWRPGKQHPQRRRQCAGAGHAQWRHPGRLQRRRLQQVSDLDAHRRVGYGQHGPLPDDDQWHDQRRLQHGTGGLADDDLQRGFNRDGRHRQQLSRSHGRRELGRSAAGRSGHRGDFLGHATEDRPGNDVVGRQRQLLRRHNRRRRRAPVGEQLRPGQRASAADGGTLDLNGYGVVVPSFSGAVGTVTSSSGLAAFTVNQSNTTTFAGTLTDGLGQLRLP